MILPACYPHQPQKNPFLPPSVTNRTPDLFRGVASGKSRPLPQGAPQTRTPRRQGRRGRRRTLAESRAAGRARACLFPHDHPQSAQRPAAPPQSEPPPPPSLPSGPQTRSRLPHSPPRPPRPPEAGHKGPPGCGLPSRDAIGPLPPQPASQGSARRRRRRPPRLVQLLHDSRPPPPKTSPAPGARHSLLGAAGTNHKRARAPASHSQTGWGRDYAAAQRRQRGR